MKTIKESELIINNDGSVYHLHLRPEHIAETIILVGDPQRVEVISGYFDKIEHKIYNREFITHTGYYNGKKLSVIGTGIGTDNIDIVVNELDALVNIDLEKRTVKKELKKLNLIRIGTSGALQGNIPIDSFLISEMACGFDGLLNFYGKRNDICDLEIESAFKKHTGWNPLLTSPYFIKSSDYLFNLLKEKAVQGVTISAPGFYGPQGRVLRLETADPKLNDKIETFEFKGKKITNFEMECSALYGLSTLLGHNAITLCAIIANRVGKKYSPDYKKTVVKLIEYCLEKLTK
ncbi:MAG: phosphorylase [Bacteroidetes bacterium GWF2_38_335]|nr:MAG: phosphorylase [Bacteroidetes bacterium GWF2_38_335]OFY80094.1 MAG: phosphorylase [Bacteroidetes bacterium RIFOXYA12_FULL_38_20]HBS88580.1 phosphorylase [Bacteroidales bacterium]